MAATGADLLQLALQLLPEDVLEQGDMQVTLPVFQEGEADAGVFAPLQGHPEADPAPVGDSGQGQGGAPGGGGGELPLGALDELEQADDLAAVHGQEGGAAVGIEEELPQGLQSQVQGSIVGFMKPEQRGPALPVVRKGPVVGQEWQTR